MRETKVNLNLSDIQIHTDTQAPRGLVNVELASICSSSFSITSETLVILEHGHSKFAWFQYTQISVTTVSLLTPVPH